MNKESKLPVFTNVEFNGVWPVGSAAVVSAETPERAAWLLEAKLTEIGLRQPVKASDMKLFESNQEAVEILNDGDY